VEHSGKIEELSKMLEEVKSEKAGVSWELLVTQERLEGERESNRKNKKLLEEEEEKNREIKGLTNNLIKEK
jgi:hypothetical protein